MYIQLKVVLRTLDYSSLAMAEPKTTIETIANTCIAGRFRLLNRVLTNLYDDAFRPLGVKLSQGNILAITARLGVARPAKVCEILQLDTSTLSRNVDRMIASGWLERVAEEDSRLQPFRLTPAGKKLLEASIPAWEAAQEQAKNLLGPGGITLLENLLKNVLKGKPRR